MKECYAHLDDLMPLFVEQLSQGKSVVFSPKGISMRPMIRQGIDSVVLSPITDKLRKYDIPLYKYPDGKYVLHRIVQEREADYLCLGDNTFCYEIVKPEYLIAVVTAFKRRNRMISVRNFGYQIYCRVWIGCYPLRRLIRRGVNWIRRRL